MSIIKKIFWIIALFILLAIMVCIIWIYNRNKDNTNDINDKNIKITNKQIILCSDYLTEDNTKCNNEIVIDTETNNIKVLYNLNNVYLLYQDDDKVKLFNGTYSETLNMSATFSDYKIIGTAENILGVAFKKRTDGKYTFYSMKLNKNIYEDSYDEINMFSSNYIQAIQKTPSMSKISIITSDKESELLSYEYEENKKYKPIFMAITQFPNEYIVLKNMCLVENCTSYYQALYGNSFNIISDNFIDYKINEDNSVSLLQNNEIITCDNYGNIIEKDTSFGEILTIEDKYILHKKDNSIKISTLNMTVSLISNIDDKNKLIDYSSSDGKIIVNIESDYATLDKVWIVCSKKSSCLTTTKEELSNLKCKYGYRNVFDTNKIELKKEETAFCN